MTFTYEDEININNFSFDYQQQMLGIVIDKIKDNFHSGWYIYDELMTEIKAECCAKLKEYGETKLTLQDLIDLKIEDVAQESLDKVVIYINADIEVEL